MSYFIFFILCPRRWASGLLTQWQSSIYMQRRVRFSQSPQQPVRVRVSFIIFMRFIIFHCESPQRWASPQMAQRWRIGPAQFAVRRGSYRRCRFDSCSEDYEQINGSNYTRPPILHTEIQGMLRSASLLRGGSHSGIDGDSEEIPQSGKAGGS